MSELEEKLIHYSNAYYQGNELISDAEYDALVEKLKKDNPNSELFNKVVGSDIKGVDKKYKLDITMGTLNKCNSEEQMKEWWKKHPHDDLWASLKIDGNGVYLAYKNGKFVYARSRGDGEYGLDYTDKVLKIASIPTSLKTNFSGFIRGEIYMLRSTWKKNFSNQKNPRNTCAGILGKKEPEDCKYLNFIAYEVFDNEEKVDKTENDKFTFLQKEGFDVPEYIENPTLEQLFECKNKIVTDGEIPCDGIVIRQNKVDKNDLLRQIPLEACALKPNLQVGVTKMIDVEWSMMGRYLSPVAILEPVELEGTTVQRASLSNLNVMKELNAGIGDTVYVEKRGLIIPKIIGVAERLTKTNNWNIPTTCPVCGGPVIVNNSGILECVTETCPRKVGHRFKKMFKVFGIKGVGDSFVSKLEDAGITIEDFLEMCKNDDKKILNKYAGGINGEKIYTQMRDAMGKQISAAKFLAIFDEPMLDEKRFLLFGNKTLDELILLSIKGKGEIMNFKGIGEEIADAYIKFFNKNKEEIFALRQYFTFESVYDIIEENENGGKKMSMPTICFTGACLGFTRKELTEKCQGKYDVKDSVTKDLDYLACADPNSGSSKLQKAAKNGTKIISYDELLKTL